MARGTIEGDRNNLVYPEYLQDKLEYVARKLNVDSVDELINDFLGIRIFVDEERMRLGVLNEKVMVKIGDVLIIEELLMNGVPAEPAFRKRLRIRERHLGKMEPIIGNLPGRENVSQYVRSAIALGLRIVELMDQQDIPNSQLGFVIKINDKETIFM